MTEPRETRSTCPYCGVGCGVIIESRAGQITGVRGDPDHPANFGRLCSKGNTLHLSASAPVTLQTRLLQPLLRPARGQAAQPVGWDEALEHASGVFARTIREHGRDAVGFYISGQLLTEDYYVFNKLAKGLIGSNNIDSNSRLCMSSAVAGYKATLGADAPPACYDDIAQARTIFIAGSNTAWAHPILMRRIEDAQRANPALRLIVADPRRTETAEAADLHLPLLPGSDVALFNGMLHLMLWEGWTDTAYIDAHTQGFDTLKARVREFTPRETARITGLREEQIVQAARWFAGLDGARDGGDANSAAAAGALNRTPTLSLYCQGLNQSSSGTAKNAALINLHLACGQIGKPGAGPLSLTGQPNAMGGREVGGMANLLSGHRDLGNAQHRAEVARLWGVDEVPAQPGKTAVEMFEAAADGEIKALWIACTNPAQSMPDQATVRRALQRCEFVVLQEAFATTATAAFADLLLPATTWGEKDGSVTNSERRISRVRPAVHASGQAQHDWQIVVDFARRLEAQLRPGQPSLFAYKTPESIWNEHRESTRGRDLDITGLSYAMLETRGPQQWPLREGQAQGQARLYEDGRFATDDGRANFVDTPFVPLAEPRDGRYPFSLNTGRLRDQWHGMSRTGSVGRLFGHAAEPAVEIHPSDARRLAVVDGDLLQVTSRRGSVLLPVRSTDTVAPTQAFVPMHWGEEFVSGRSSVGAPLAGINALTSPAFCPRSKQPELKHSAVKLLKAELPWKLLGVAWIAENDVQRVQQALRQHLPLFAFAACVPFGHQRGGLLFRAAHHEAAAAGVVEAIEALLGLDPHDALALRYLDKRRGQRRSIGLSSDGTRVDRFVLSGDISAEAWLKALLQDELEVHAYRRALLSPGLRPPVPLDAASPRVCTCLNVSQARIVAQLQRCDGAPEQRLAQLQAALKCGTECGSCVPALKQLVRAGLPLRAGSDQTSAVA